MQVLGWDLVLPQMAVGEVVRLVCSPAYAFGERGAPPLIPPNSHVHFVVELLSIRYLRSSHDNEEVCGACIFVFTSSHWLLLALCPRLTSLQSITESWHTNLEEIDSNLAMLIFRRHIGKGRCVWLLQGSCDQYALCMM